MKIYYSNINDYSIEELLPLVCKERRERSLKYRFDSDKKRSLLAHVLLNHALLKSRSQITLPAEPVTDTNGKPHLYDGEEEIRFSLSHSGDYAVCAISDIPIGVDIEKIEDYKPEIASRFFNKSELKYIKDADTFYRIWTLKESYIKTVGLGLKMPLDSFIVSDLDKVPGTCIYLNENGSDTGLRGSTIITEDRYALSLTCRTLPKDGLKSVLSHVRSLPQSYT